MEGGTAETGGGKHRHPAGDCDQQQGVTTEAEVRVHEQRYGDGERALVPPPPQAPQTQVLSTLNICKDKRETFTVVFVILVICIKTKMHSCSQCEFCFTYFLGPDSKICIGFELNLRFLCYTLVLEVQGLIPRELTITITCTIKNQ